MAAIFDGLKHHRDRALLSFWPRAGYAPRNCSASGTATTTSTNTFVVTGKGTRNRDVVPASADAFVWLALYMQEGQPSSPGDPAEEWKEFEQHFLLRRVALGTCHRPYATPCVHEHACVKCRFLQVDPAQAGRLETMTENAGQRLTEARGHQWLGEVSALEESLVHLRRRRVESEKLRTDKSQTHPV